jgi:HPr kinase/phosphorylase
LKYEIPSFIVTNNITPPETLINEASSLGIPIFQTKLETGLFIERITKFLEDRLSPITFIHGDLVEVFGVGVIVIGESGAGKSEAVLDLILKGHRLVSDDVVEIQRKNRDLLFGSAPNNRGYYMEIRGLGIIDIKNLFGISSIRNEKRVELVIELIHWDSIDNIERLGLDEKNYDILGINLPHFRIPVSPGRNISTIIEIAVRNYLLKKSGHDTLSEFLKSING